MTCKTGPCNHLLWGWGHTKDVLQPALLQIPMVVAVLGGHLFCWLCFLSSDTLFHIQIGENQLTSPKTETKRTIGSRKFVDTVSLPASYGAPFKFFQNRLRNPTNLVWGCFFKEPSTPIYPEFPISQHDFFSCGFRISGRFPMIFPRIRPLHSRGQRGDVILAVQWYLRPTFTG